MQCVYILFFVFNFFDNPINKSILHFIHFHSFVIVLIKIDCKNNLNII